MFIGLIFLKCLAELLRSEKKIIFLSQFYIYEYFVIYSDSFARFQFMAKMLRVVGGKAASKESIFYS